MMSSIKGLLAGVFVVGLAAASFPALADDGVERRSMRQLASDLASRLGSDRVELRAGESAIEIEAVGERAREAAALFATRIPAKDLLLAMNRERESRGLAPLRFSRRLTLAAGDRLEEMLELRYFAHVSPDGREPFEAIQERGYDFSDAGENLAAGFSSANAVVAAWLKSPGHRENLLSPAFESVGVAICKDPPAEGMRGHTFVALYGAE